MDKTKIQFKALRESLGLTAKDIAEAVNVKQTTVLAWDNNNRTDIRPSQAGWDFLEEKLAEQQEIIARAADSLSKSETPAPVFYLLYFRNQGDYKESGHEGSYSVHNANMRAIAAHCRAAGLCKEIQFIEHSDPFAEFLKTMK